MAGLGGFAPGLFDLTSLGGLLRTTALMLLVAAVLHVLSGPIVRRKDLLEAATAAALGVLLAFLADAAVATDAVAWALALVLFAGIVALVYRAQWARCAALGAVGWVAFMLFGLGIQALLSTA